MAKTWSDEDPIETKEWLDAFAALTKHAGKDRAYFMLQQLLQQANRNGIDGVASLKTTAYVNTIAVGDEPSYPGDLKLEAMIEAAIRWNAIVMVLRAKQSAGGVGGHLASFASIATLYEVGMNHFFRGATDKQLGDLVYFQGHSSEGNYARAYLEGRLTEDNLNRFRQEVQGNGLSSYPHPWLMPNFWQFATVSLGLGMLQAVYQARFLHYLSNRGLVPAGDRKVWVFCGDGEMDEPESTAGLTLAAREKLDNLICVVNCNLQRLDGLVRSNGKIVQELEGLFRGAGWNVIKVLWDSVWDDLFAKDKKGLLANRLGECVDGDIQTVHVKGIQYFREFLFNTDELRALIQGYSDDDLLRLHRGAHDPIKVYAAYAAAVKHKGQPTVILTQSVKGYGLGIHNAEGRNIAHNALDMSLDELKAFRDRFQLTLSDHTLEHLEFYKPDVQSDEMRYLQARRAELGGFLPAREAPRMPLTVPPLSAYDVVLKGSGDRTMSTTMVLGRIFNMLLKDKGIGSRMVPIFSDEVRTFGMEALFRQIGIYSPVGQLYHPEDKEQFLYYHEATDGQVLEEGITEAGCMASWMAAATSYSTNRYPMIPFFVYYSMFGFQRVGDFIWAAADMRARGFLIGATAGRTTLEGEGLQHQDGTSLLSAAHVPTCRAYDPAFGYEMAVIIQHGLHEMYEEQRDVFYYVTAMNERYVQPAMPEGVAEGIIRGMYLLQEANQAIVNADKHVQLWGAGAILNEVLAASELLQNDFGVTADVWSITSFAELRRDAADAEHGLRYELKQDVKASYLEQCLQQCEGPIIAATDYVKAYADLVRPYVDRLYITLGTDGFGRSDTRDQLRYFFEVDKYHIAVTALSALVKEGKLSQDVVLEAMQRYGLDQDKANPTTV